MLNQSELLAEINRLKGENEVLDAKYQGMLRDYHKLLADYGTLASDYGIYVEKVVTTNRSITTLMNSLSKVE